jgi:hypothetical protein
MKLFVFVAIIIGAYYWLMISSTDMMVDQTMQLHAHYEQVAEQSEFIASGNR